MRGAIVDWLRSTDVHSRRTRQLQAERGAASERLCQTLGRRPTEEEIRAAVGMTDAKWRRSQQLNDCSGDVIVLESDNSDHYLTVFDLVLLAREIPELDRDGEFRELTRSVSLEAEVLLYLYYRRELSMGQIGQVLGVSESRISQLHGEAIRDIRRAMGQSRLADDHVA